MRTEPVPLATMILPPMAMAAPTSCPPHRRMAGCQPAALPGRSEALLDSMATGTTNVGRRVHTTAAS
eukprot:5793947-Alexandrium_andersonii.AAC.1